MIHCLHNAVEEISPHTSIFHLQKYSTGRFHMTMNGSINNNINSIFFSLSFWFWCRNGIIFFAQIVFYKVFFNVIFIQNNWYWWHPIFTAPSCGARTCFYWIKNDNNNTNSEIYKLNFNVELKIVKNHLNEIPIISCCSWSNAIRHQQTR